MSDGCVGQNKKSPTLKTVEIIFPVTGHSYMPADRVFGLTETKIRKLETIVDPKEYEEIMAEHAMVYKLGTEVPVYDYRTAVGEVVKPTNEWHFQITKIKRVILRRGKRTHKILTRGEISYQSDTGSSEMPTASHQNFHGYDSRTSPAGSRREGKEIKRCGNVAKYTLRL
ncbi:unnamed protein product [Pieris macdunnoughi]|uniref:Uncharacterized protein n=1 Tax=Pieris macdunnoughi TaxID=345717 RepID=A0A821XR90_9NEOP|nr:unnamed protein product [Pieris macdunnoughi]